MKIDEVRIVKARGLLAEKFVCSIDDVEFSIDRNKKKLKFEITL